MTKQKKPIKNSAVECPIVAAFDFDGTITYRDTLLPFIVFAVGPIKAGLHFLKLLPMFIGFIIDKTRRQETKEAVITSFFKGISIDELRDIGADFARKRLKGHLKPEAMRRLEWHKNQGHHCVLISANLDVYLQPWAEANGFDDVLTSFVAADEDNKVTGKLAGLNCWGPEKMRRLEQLLGPRSGFQLYAYGDSRGDMEMLSSADHAYYRKIPILEGSLEH